MLYTQTEFCGWGVEVAETIEKGEFIIEYVGEGRSYF
jgi:histone-lysine N-methyltransferase SETD2